MRAIAFDLDGTLVDTMRLAPRVYATTIHQLGGPHLTSYDITSVWHIGSTEVVLAYFLQRPVTKWDLETYFATFARAFARVQAFPGIAAMLDNCRQLGFVLGVFTAATRRAASTMLEASGLVGRVDGVVAGDEIAMPKPHPDGLHALCTALGTVAADTIYVGDAQVDIECAHGAGAVAVWAAWGQGDTPDPVPRHVARSPVDVVRLARELGRPIVEGDAADGE